MYVLQSWSVSTFEVYFQGLTKLFNMIGVYESILMLQDRCPATCPSMKDESRNHTEPTQIHCVQQCLQKANSPPFFRILLWWYTNYTVEKRSVSCGLIRRL